MYVCRNRLLRSDCDQAFPPRCTLSSPVFGNGEGSGQAGKRDEFVETVCSQREHVSVFRFLLLAHERHVSVRDDEGSPRFRD